MIRQCVLSCISPKRRILTTIILRNCCNNTPIKTSCSPSQSQDVRVTNACMQRKPLNITDCTINLAHQGIKSCVKPIQQTLVTKPSEKCPELTKPPVVSGVQKINICNTEDLKKACPCKPCDCPPRGPPETLLERIKRYVKFLLKAAVAGIVVLWTIDEGFWTTDAKRASEIYQNVYSGVAMFHGIDMEAQDVKIPKTDQMIHDVAQLWNKGVVLVCGFIAKTPGRLIGLVISPKECPQSTAEGPLNMRLGAYDDDDFCEDEEECE